MSNYRPISLLPIFSKILEKVMYFRMSDYLKHNCIIGKYQYGFREKHSTTHAITDLINNVLNAFENQEYLIATFMDISKVF